jgi:hypothetical protein
LAEQKTRATDARKRAIAKYRKAHRAEYNAYCKDYRRYNVERYGPNETLTEYRKTLHPQKYAAQTILGDRLGYSRSTIASYEIGYLKTPDFVNEYVRKKMAEQNR